MPTARTVSVTATVMPVATEGHSSRRRGVVALVAGTLACLVAQSGHAELSEVQKKCFAGIAKSGKSFVLSRLKTLKKCADADLKAPGHCDPIKRDAALAKADAALAKGLAKACAFSGTAVSQAANLANMTFPGQCPDPTSGDGFTTSDLQACMQQSHTAIADVLFAIEYDDTLAGPLGTDELGCQKELAKDGQKVAGCVLKSVQKCRQAIINGKISGIAPERCQVDDDKTEAAIDKCKVKAGDAIRKKCGDAEVTSLRACEPDQDNANDAAGCVVNTHLDLVDSLDPSAPTDLIDYEYADPGICGDGKVNSPDEECDGADDVACPGLCGTAELPDGYFACLCKSKPRERIVEHANADLDDGWSGQSHDAGVVEGGGYVGDLSDCDGSGTCIVGPSCSLPPHAPCGTTGGPPLQNANAICAGLGQGTCRKERTAIGPHCFVDIAQECDPRVVPSDPICNAPGDFCVKSLHGPPTPIPAGGVPVCVVTIFSEDVVGTTNILTGATSIRVREYNVTHTGLSIDKPCPVCGGFCAADRTRCTVDDDCSDGGPCVTAPLCSDGPNAGKACRQSPPFGGSTTLFGTISSDCPPDASSDISNGGLDLLYDPLTTGQVTRLPSYPCNAPGFTGNACLGGPSEGRACTAASECPSGVCTGQCFCPSVGGVSQKPNECDPACVGGTNDAGGCLDDSECPGGFCHRGDCRPNPADSGSSGEGRCTTGPFDGTCSISQSKGCTVDADCQGINCTFCQPGETCVTKNRECFVNSGIVRHGTVGFPNRTVTTTFCIPATGATAVDGVSGLPGPGAHTWPVTAIVVP